MICNGYDKVLDLADGELLEVDDARGTTLRLTKGRVWITQEHDTRDIVLSPGDTWTVERQGVTLIESIGATTLCLVGAAARSARGRERGPDPVAPIARFFEKLGARLGRRWAPYL